MRDIWLKSGRFERTPLPFANRLELCLQTSRPHSVGYGECGREVCTRISQRLTNGRGVRPCPTAVCGTAAGTRRSPVGTLNMGTWAGTGEALGWYIASDVPSISPSQGSNSVGHTGSHAVRIRTLLNVHVHMTRATSLAHLPVARWAQVGLRSRDLLCRSSGAHHNEPRTGYTYSYIRAWTRTWIMVQWSIRRQDFIRSSTEGGLRTAVNRTFSRHGTLLLGALPVADYTLSRAASRHKRVRVPSMSIIEAHSQRYKL